MNAPFVLSDESVNSYGFSVDLSKLKLERFKKNPVMMYNHDQLVGKWGDIRIEGGKLLATPIFMEDASEELALKIKKRVETGFLKGASLGLSVLEVTRKKGQSPSVEAEVFECSVCDIPSNGNAIALYNKEGVKLEGKKFDFALSAITEKETDEKVNTQKMLLNTKNLKELKLEKSFDEVSLNQAIEKLCDERDALKSQVEKHQEEKIENLLSQGMREGRFTTDKKETFQKLAQHNFDLAKQTIASLPPKNTLAGKEQLSSNPEIKEGRSAWNFDEWRKKDAKGLLSIKNENPEKYEEILHK